MANFSKEDADKLAKVIENAFSKAVKNIGEDIKEEFGEENTSGIGKGLDKLFPQLNKFKTLTKEIGASWITVGSFIVNAGVKADKSITALARSMSATKGQAAAARFELVRMAAASGDAFITAEKLVDSTLKLQQQLGVAQMFSSDITTEFTKLTGKIGISAESAAGLSRISIALGKNARTVTTEALGTARALESQAGILLNETDILEEVGNTSGQLLANFKGSPGAISSAITQARLLGTTLEQTKRQSESLLDFESSIANELQAELITGRQLNLERARGAALLGDQETVMKELANQNLNFSKFSQMNVIAQRSIASALGLSADELTNQLIQQQFLNKSRQEVVALAGEEIARRKENLDLQQKFEESINKLKAAVVNLLDGRIGQILDFFVGTTYNAAGGVVQSIGTSTFAPATSSPMSAAAASATPSSLIDYDKLAMSMSKVQLRPQVDIREISEKQLQTARR